MLSEDINLDKDSSTSVPGSSGITSPRTEEKQPKTQEPKRVTTILGNHYFQSFFVV